MLIAIWAIALLCIGLWTLAAWGLHGLLSIDPSRLQDLKPLIHEIPYGETIDQWFPAWRALLAVAVDMTQRLAAWLGDVGPWLVWVLWGTGTVLAVLFAAGISLAVVLIRRGIRISEQQRIAGSAPL